MFLKMLLRVPLHVLAYAIKYIATYVSQNVPPGTYLYGNKVWVLGSRIALHH